MEDQTAIEQPPRRSPLRTSEGIDKLVAAMAKAQQELENPIRDKKAKIQGKSKDNDKDYNFEYSYSDIADILATCRPILAKHGVALFQLPLIRNSTMIVVTRLACEDQWIESDYPVCQIGGDHKAMGSALTYARRYALGAMIGIAPERDDDAASAAPPSAGQPQQQRPAAGAPAVLDRFKRDMRDNPTVEKLDEWARSKAILIKKHLTRNEQDVLQDAYNEWRNDLLAREDERRAATPNEAQTQAKEAPFEDDGWPCPDTGDRR